MPDNDLLFRYEEGDLDFEEMIILFEQIWNAKAYLWLQGHYGRTLKDLIDEGYIAV